MHTDPHESDFKKPAGWHALDLKINHYNTALIIKFLYFKQATIGKFQHLKLCS